jgi:predicted ferric reductase
MAAPAAAPASRWLPPARAALWLGAYVALVVVPLFALLPDATTPGAGFVWDFSMALGYAALAMLGVQFALTARFRRATAPFGIDLIYYFHRFLAVFAALIALAHYGVLKAAYPVVLGAADPRLAPAHMTAGRVALLLFVLLVVSSLARRRLRIEYDFWRWSHALVATVAFALALWHVLAAGRYLDTAWKQALWAGYGVFWLALVGWVRLVRPWRISRDPYRVVEVRPERGRVCTLVLEPASGRPLRFRAGQFGWLTLRASPFALREHPFSIASSAERGGRIELAIKELGDFTRTIRSVRPGETAYFDAPYGAFGCDFLPSARGYVFVAGGIGIAPIVGQLRTLADRGDRRRHLLFYGSRNWERVALREEVEALARRLDLTVVHVLHEPEEDWAGERGLITQELLARHLPQPHDGYEFLLCGPTPMTRAVERSLAALGVPAAHVHSEIFDWV